MGKKLKEAEELGIAFIASIHPGKGYDMHPGSPLDSLDLL
jgi:hypothetical protein